jgi:hypothetical protein
MSQRLQRSSWRRGNSLVIPKFPPSILLGHPTKTQIRQQASITSSDLMAGHTINPPLSESTRFRVQARVAKEHLKTSIGPARAGIREEDVHLPCVEGAASIQPAGGTLGQGGWRCAVEIEQACAAKPASSSWRTNLVSHLSFAEVVSLGLSSPPTVSSPSGAACRSSKVRFSLQPTVVRFQKDGPPSALGRPSLQPRPHINSHSRPVSILKKHHEQARVKDIDLSAVLLGLPQSPSRPSG